MSRRTGAPPPVPPPPERLDVTNLTMDERVELERERAQATQKLLKLAAARQEAEDTFEQLSHQLAAAWRANQARPRGRYKTSEVVAATGIRRSTFDNWAKKDRAGDSDVDVRADGNHNLVQFAEFAQARQDAKDELDKRTAAMAQAWRTIQANPRTKSKVQPIAKLTGVAKTTLIAWLNGTYNPSGPMYARARRQTGGGEEDPQ